MTTVKDFFGEELAVGDCIVYAGSQGSHGAHLSAGVITEITNKVRGGWGNPTTVVVVEKTKPKSARPVTLTRFDTIVKMGHREDR